MARRLFKLDVKMKLRKQEVIFDTVVCTFDLQFDNSAFILQSETALKRKEGSLPIKAATLFEMFPFCILYQVF